MKKECSQLIWYGTSKDLVIEKEKIKCKNIINWYKKWLTLMIKEKHKGT